LGVSIPSESEYAEQRDSGSDFSLFPADDYILEVQSVTEQPGKVDIFDKPKPGEAQRTYTGLEVRFRIISFANGDEIVDENGADIPAARNPLFFDWFDPERVGLKPQPAKARKFFAFSTGKELEDRIDIENWSDLVGKRLIGVVIVKTNAAGVRRNKVTDYRPIRTRRRAAAAASATHAPEAKLAPDLTAAAKEIFKDDLTDDLSDLPF
jgi:hypothetical protein